MNTSPANHIVHVISGSDLVRCITSYETEEGLFKCKGTSTGLSSNQKDNPGHDGLIPVHRVLMLQFSQMYASQLQSRSPLFSRKQSVQSTENIPSLTSLPTQIHGNGTDVHSTGQRCGVKRRIVISFRIKEKPYQTTTIKPQKRSRIIIVVVIAVEASSHPCQPSSCQPSSRHQTIRLSIHRSLTQSINQNGQVQSVNSCTSMPVSYT
jgi:hypothetical protein